MISTGGIPVAMSKMISESVQNRTAQARKIFRTAFALFVAIGAFFLLIMLLFAPSLPV